MRNTTARISSGFARAIRASFTSTESWSHHPRAGAAALAMLAIENARKEVGATEAGAAIAGDWVEECEREKVEVADAIVYSSIKVSLRPGKRWLRDSGFQEL